MTTPLTALYDHWTRPSYERRVRGTALDPTYLWGSVGITQNFSSSTPLVLHIRNDTFGEVITLGTQVASGTSETQSGYGTLQPAECISISLQNLSGVFAFPGTDQVAGTESVVACVITS
jgi:hypothetical protein